MFFFEEEVSLEVLRKWICLATARLVCVLVTWRQVWRTFVLGFMCLNFPGKQWDGVWGLGRKACWGFLRSSVGDEVVPGSLLRPGISEEFPWYRHSPWGFGLWVSCDLVYGVSILCSAFVHCATFILFLQEKKQNKTFPSVYFLHISSTLFWMFGRAV